MGFYSLQSKLFLPVSLDEAWDFFSSPANLREITPPELDFVTTSEVPDKMYKGSIITYTISPVLGIKIGWMTEITQIEEGRYFIDEQRAGPYKLWHHEHHFREVEGGIEMTDILNYILPFGILGDIAHKLFVKGQVNKIFEYRTKILLKRFQ